MDSHPSLQYRVILGMNKKLQLHEPFCGSKSRRSLSKKRRSHIAIAIKFHNVSRAIMDDGAKESTKILLHIQSFSCAH